MWLYKAIVIDAIDLRRLNSAWESTALKMRLASVRIRETALKGLVV